MTGEKTLSLRDRQKLETRQQIQETARALIVEHGYEKTTMRALARAAGVGLGTISLHFKDKKSLLLASFHEEIGHMVFGAIADVPQDASLREQLLSIVRTVYGYYGTHTVFLRSVVKEALFTRGEWREKFDHQLHESVSLVAGLFEKAKARGEVRHEIDSVQATAACWSIYINGLIQGLNAEVFDVDALVASVAPMLDVVLNGVLVQGEAV